MLTARLSPVDDRRLRYTDSRLLADILDLEALSEPASASVQVSETESAIIYRRVEIQENTYGNYHSI
jgi:hypothetical protein